MNLSNRLVFLSSFLKHYFLGDFSRERFGIKIVIVGNRRDFFSNLGVTFEDYAVVYSKELG